MQILQKCQILLHFSQIYNLPTLADPTKRCLQSQADGRNMLLIFNDYAVLNPLNSSKTLAQLWGGRNKSRHSNHCIITKYYFNNSNNLFVFNAGSCPQDLPSSLSARRILCSLFGSRGLQTAAADLYSYWVKTEFTEETNGYTNKENHVHRSG